MIKNLSNYNILENLEFTDSIFFTKLEKRDKEGEVFTSDNVSKLILRGEKKLGKKGDAENG